MECLKETKYVEGKIILDIYYPWLERFKLIMLKNWTNKISSKKCCHRNIKTNKWAGYLCQDYSICWEGGCSIFKIFKNILQQLRK